MDNGYLLCYEKLNTLRYVGHIDFIRAFQRAVNRAALPVSHTQGFNPRQRLSFAAPLPVGTAGLSEYAAIFLCEPINCDTIQAALNERLPAGARVNGVRAMETGEKGPASLLRAARYRAEFTTDGVDMDADNLSQVIAALPNNEPELFAKIIALDAKDGALTMTIPCGNDNLKPSAVVSGLCRIMRLPDDQLNVTYTRHELYKSQAGVLVPIFDTR